MDYTVRDKTVTDGEEIDIPDNAEGITIEQRYEGIRVSWLEPESHEVIRGSTIRE